MVCVCRGKFELPSVNINLDAQFYRGLPVGQGFIGGGGPLTFPPPLSKIPPPGDM